MKTFAKILFLIGLAVLVPACSKSSTEALFANQETQIENFLMRNDKIHDVAVIGYPHERLGEIVAAVIQVKEGMELTEEDVNRFCIDLPRYKRPRKIFFDKVIRNATGKIDKPKIREIYCSERLVERQNMS